MTVFRNDRKFKHFFISPKFCLLFFLSLNFYSEITYFDIKYSVLPYSIDVVSTLSYYVILKSIKQYKGSIFLKLICFNLLPQPFLWNFAQRMILTQPSCPGGVLVMWTLLGVCRSQGSLLSPDSLAKGVFLATIS